MNARALSALKIHVPVIWKDKTKRIENATRSTWDWYAQCNGIRDRLETIDGRPCMWLGEPTGGFGERREHGTTYLEVWITVAERT